MSRKTIEDNTTINGGETSVSEIIITQGSKDLSLSFRGDSESKDLDVLVETKVNEFCDWTEFDRIEALDLTENEGTGLTEVFDVSDVAEIRTRTRNNLNNPTVITINANTTNL